MKVVKLTEEEAKLVLEFLKRSQMSGAEAPHFIKVAQALTTLVEDNVQEKKEG